MRRRRRCGHGHAVRLTGGLRQANRLSDIDFLAPLSSVRRDSSRSCWQPPCGFRIYFDRASGRYSHHWQPGQPHPAGLGPGQDAREWDCRLSRLKQLQLCWQLYVDDFQNRVAPNRSVALYHCPTDPSKVLNSNRLRTRSHSRNGNLGGRTNAVQNPVNRYDAIPRPGPALCVDRRGGGFDGRRAFPGLAQPDTRWVSRPADRHGQTDTLSFGDGHAERWAWQWLKRFSPKQSYRKMVES